MDTSNLTDQQREALSLIVSDDFEATKHTLAAQFGVTPSGAKYYIEKLREHGFDIDWDRETRQYVYTGSVDLTAESSPETDADTDADTDEDADTDTDDESDSPDLPDLSDVEQGDDPDPSDLNDRERYIVRELQTGVTPTDLADDLDTRESIVTQHLRDLKSSGWHVYVDESAEMVAIEGDTTLRSSEHKGTRTRKANRWWERRHSALVRDFKSLDTPQADLSFTAGQEDWVIHLTDIHAGDKVHTPDGTNVYNSGVVPEIVRYIGAKALELYRYHGVDCDTAHLLLGGDLITGEGIYSGQFEDLDAWLDEQHDMMVEPLLELIKALSDEFNAVNVVAQVGNHGKSRASGTSRQANADLILYKSVRNAIAAAQKYAPPDDPLPFGNVSIQLSEGRPYANFTLRGGRLNGHLRHGQDRKPQAVTAAGSNEWGTTLMSHEFDVCFIGHHHISGRIPWDGPPVIVSGSPKCPSDFVDRIAGSTSLDPRDRAREIAHCVAVADHGLTATYPIKTHDFDYLAPEKWKTSTPPPGSGDGAATIVDMEMT